MKLNLVFALAAVLAASPLLPVAAAEEKKDAAAAEAAGPTPEQLKALPAEQLPALDAFMEKNI